MNIKIKKIGLDFIFNIMAILVLTATQQLVVYPGISRICGSNEYGAILTIMGIVYTVSGTMGEGLNKLRLILNKDYFDKGLKGDFNILLIFNIILLLMLSMIDVAFFKLISKNLFIAFILVLLTTLRLYLSVEFRLNLNYAKVLYLNFIISFAYLIVVMLYVIYRFNSHFWYMIFIIAELSGNIYLIYYTNLLKEPLVKTYMFFNTLKKYCIIMYLSFVSNIIYYLDRSIIYPLLGGEAVAVFFAATAVGKAVGLLISPMSIVLLSYLSQSDFRLDRKRYWKINILSSLLGIICYIFVIMITDFTVNIFYPSLYENAKQFFILANIIPILGGIANMSQPTVLRYASLNKQAIIQTIELFVSVSVFYFSIKNSGLNGLCMACIFLYIMRILVLWFLGDQVVRYNDNI